MEQREPHAGGNPQRRFHDADLARQFQRQLRGIRPVDVYGSASSVVYDESGYPIERRTSLAGRVRRLITG